MVCQRAGVDNVKRNPVRMCCHIELYGPTFYRTCTKSGIGGLAELLLPAEEKVIW